MFTLPFLFNQRQGYGFASEIRNRVISFAFVPGLGKMIQAPEQHLDQTHLVATLFLVTAQKDNAVMDLRRFGENIPSSRKTRTASRTNPTCCHSMTK